MIAMREFRMHHTAKPLVVMLFGLTLIGVSALLRVATAEAQPDPSKASTYELGSDSRFMWGCFGPCACPVLYSQPLTGTFELKYVSSDPLFNNYTVSNVRWDFPDGSSNQIIRGAGTYRVGGEFAVQQQMILDLFIGNQPSKHFDSGLVQGGGEFPKIDIDISLHQNQACRDTVIHIQAADPPAVTSVDTGRGSPGFRLDRVVPNPFSAEASVQLTLDRAERVDVAIYDVQGRFVRRLAAGMTLAAGPNEITWDGRRYNGSMCGTGVYFVKAGAAGHRSSRRFVKVQ